MKMPLVNRIARFPELANWKVGFISRKESKGNSRVRYETVFKSRFWPSLHDDPRQQISEAGHRHGDRVDETGDFTGVEKEFQKVAPFTRLVSSIFEQGNRHFYPLCVPRLGLRLPFFPDG